MDATGAGILIGLLCIIGILVAWWRWARFSLEKAKEWPQSEATIETGGLEVVFSSRYGQIRLPVFAFSYVVNGEYYSGRFALKPYTVEYDESIIARMIGRKLPVCYGPLRPDQWVIPDEMIEGYKVEQKTGPHLIGLYPRE